MQHKPFFLVLCTLIAVDCASGSQGVCRNATTPVSPASASPSTSASTAISNPPTAASNAPKTPPTITGDIDVWALKSDEFPAPVYFERGADHSIRLIWNGKEFTGLTVHGNEFAVMDSARTRAFVGTFDGNSLDLVSTDDTHHHALATTSSFGWDDKFDVSGKGLLNGQRVWLRVQNNGEKIRGKYRLPQSSIDEIVLHEGVIGAHGELQFSEKRDAGDAKWTLLKLGDSIIGTRTVGPAIERIFVQPSDSVPGVVDLPDKHKIVPMESLRTDGKCELDVIFPSIIGNGQTSLESLSSELFTDTESCDHAKTIVRRYSLFDAREPFVSIKFTSQVSESGSAAKTTDACRLYDMRHGSTIDFKSAMKHPARFFDVFCKAAPAACTAASSHRDLLAQLEFCIEKEGIDVEPAHDNIAGLPANTVHLTFKQIRSAFDEKSPLLKALMGIK